jgi:hypothetical protein
VCDSSGGRNANAWHWEDLESYLNRGDGFKWTGGTDCNVGTAINLNAEQSTGFGFNVNAGSVNNQFISLHANANVGGNYKSTVGYNTWTNIYSEAGVGNTFVIDNSSVYNQISTTGGANPAFTISASNITNQYIAKDNASAALYHNDFFFAPNDQAAASFTVYALRSGHFNNGVMSFWDNTNNATMLTYDNTNRWIFRQNATMAAATTLTGPAFVTSSANPALSGIFRLNKLDSLNFRNNANSADITSISLDSSDRVVVGGSAGAALGTGSSSLSGVEHSLPANPAATNHNLFPLTSVGWCSQDSAGAQKCPFGTINTQTGTTYTIATTDAGKLITFNNAGAVAVTLPQANSTTFPSGFAFGVKNLGVGTVTITPTTSTLDGAASLAVTTGNGTFIFGNGTNYNTSSSVSGGGGSSAFSAITGSTNTTAAMVVGSGASITPTGTGIIDATKAQGIAISATAPRKNQALYYNGTSHIPTYVVPTLGTRRWALIEAQENASAVSSFGTSVTTTGAALSSQAASSTNAYSERLQQSAATINTNAGFSSGTTTWRTGRNLYYEARYITTDVTDIRIVLGWSDQSLATMVNADNPAGNYAVFMFCNDSAAGCTVDNTNWQCKQKDNTTQSAADSGVAVTAGTEYLMQVWQDDSNSGQEYYTINGTDVCSSPRASNPPTTSTNMGWVMGHQTLAASTRQNHVATLFLSSDK